MERLIVFFRQKEWLVIVLLLVLFVSLRLPGIGLPLHQDEYKWPMIVNPALSSETEIPHPPLSQFIYRTAGELVGFNVNFRLVPLFFGTINLLLLYYLLRTNFSRKVAAIASLLFSLSYFSVLASLMVDTDGQIMPFFFLLSLIGYTKVQKNSGQARWFWSSLLLLSAVAGFFVKVSFMLPILAIVFDFLWQRRQKISRKDLIKYSLLGLGGLIILSLLLIVSQYVFSFFNLTTAIGYWEHFVRADRNWFQTAIQVVKAILYLSPLLLLLPFYLKRVHIEKTMPFILYIVFGLGFYLILFDFSIGALDRYLQFLIVPVCAMSAVVIGDELKSQAAKNLKYFFWGSIFSLVIFKLLFLTNSVPSLHPKAEWITRILSLKWNFLYPFSGGSGPLGFYVSFLFMALAWIGSGALFILGLFKSGLRSRILLALIPISLIYNLTFTEEYLFGRINGSAPKLLTEVVEYIKNNDEIKSVTVYNDNGGAEIQAIGKYRKRLYTDPAFDLNEKIATLNKYKEHYLEIDIPKIDPSSVYRRYLDSCPVIYDKKDREISARVYDCRGVKDIKK